MQSEIFCCVYFLLGIPYICQRFSGTDPCSLVRQDLPNLLQSAAQRIMLKKAALWFCIAVSTSEIMPHQMVVSQRVMWQQITSSVVRIAHNSRPKCWM
jgi:hypothetical protein